MVFIVSDYSILQVADKLHKIEVRITLKKQLGTLVYYKNDESEDCDSDDSDVSYNSNNTDKTDDTKNNHGLQKYKQLIDNEEMKWIYYLLEDIFDLLDNGGHYFYELTFNFGCIKDINLEQINYLYNSHVDDFNDIFINIRPEYRIIHDDLIIKIDYKYKTGDGSAFYVLTEQTYRASFKIIHRDILTIKEYDAHDKNKIINLLNAPKELKIDIYKNIIYQRVISYRKTLNKSHKYNVEFFKEMDNERIFPLLDIEEELNKKRFDDF